MSEHAEDGRVLLSVVLCTGSAVGGGRVDRVGAKKEEEEEAEKKKV